MQLVTLPRHQRSWRITLLQKISALCPLLLSNSSNKIMYRVHSRNPRKRKGKIVQILQRVSCIQNCVHSEDSASTNIDTGIVSSSEFEYLEALRKYYHCDDEPGGPVPRVFFVLVNRLPSTNPSFSFRVPPNWYYPRLITPSCAWQSTNCTYCFGLHTYSSSILPLANERIRLCAVFALSVQMPFHFLTGSWLNLSDDSRACKRLPPPLSLSPLQSFS